MATFLTQWSEKQAYNRSRDSADVNGKVDDGDTDLLLERPEGLSPVYYTWLTRFMKRFSAHHLTEISDDCLTGMFFLTSMTISFTLP